MQILSMRILMLAVLGLFACAATANECKFSAERNLDIDAAGLHAVMLKLGSSDAHATGVAGLTKIEVRGKACASEESRLAGLTVSQSRDGDHVVVTPNQAHEQTFSWFGSDYAYIDLDVRLPATLALQIETTSGDANVADVASLDYSSHSGDLMLHHAGGAVAVEVHSGDVNADDIGAFSLRRSGSGDVRANKVRGDVKVGHVGSGDLGFTDVTGSVNVESVGSGDVNVDRVGGDIVIGSIGSGDVTVDGVGGGFTVKSAGSGDIHHHNVKGKIDLPKRDED
jgi:hypothetical protein